MYLTSASEDANRVVARRVASARRTTGLTLSAVATRSGLSPAYLSQIESGSANPTVGTLARVAAGLGSDVGGLLGDGDGRRLVERFEPRFATVPLLAQLPDGAGVWDLTAVGSARLFVRLVRGAPADHAEPISHPGEEFVAVLSGQCDLRVGSVVRTLHPADGCHFSASDQHQITAPSDDLLLLVILSEERAG